MTRRADVESIVRGAVPEDESYILGFADLTGLLPVKYRAYPYAVVLGKKLDDRIVDAIAGGPTGEYRELYRATNAELSRRVRSIAAALKPHRVGSVVIEPTLSEEQLDENYQRTLRTDFSHKMAGTRAGLGWIGKTDLFVSERFGPRLRLATVLVEQAAGLTASPVEESRCGQCAVCVQRCPAGAANGIAWKAGLERELFFDPFACREKCLELSMKGFGERISLCGICVSVCPVGRQR